MEINITIILITQAFVQQGSKEEEIRAPAGRVPN